MSVEFSLTGCKLDCAKWNELLEEWAGEQEEDLYDEPCFEEEEEVPTMLVWGDGSTRGVVLSLGEGGRDVTVRFNVLASRKDWERGFEIMKRALAQGGGSIERETGETYTAAKLTREQAHEEAITNFLFGAKSTRASLDRTEDKRALLPFAGFALPLTPADLPACTRENQAAIEEALAQRLHRYGHAFRANVFETENKARVSTWGLEPTVVGEVDFVAIEWNNNFFNVPIGRLIEILGSRVEPLGGSHYLPELDPEKDRAILDTLQKEDVDPNTAQPREVVEGQAGGGQDHEMRLIKQLTLFIMEQIAQHSNPDKAKAELVKQGMEPEVAESLIAAVSAALELMLNQKKHPKDVAQELTGHGLPQHMAAAIIDGIAEFLADEPEEEEEEE
jgi:hypothetical protein